MASPISKLQPKRRILLTAAILMPMYFLVNFNPIAVLGSVVLTTVASVVLEYMVVNYFVYKAVNEYHRQEIFNYGFNGASVVMLICLLMILVALAARNELLFFLSFFGYFLASSALVAFRCSQNRYRNYLKEYQAKNQPQ